MDTGGQLVMTKESVSEESRNRGLLYVSVLLVNWTFSTPVASAMIWICRSASMDSLLFA